jgi:threonine synthase
MMLGFAAMASSGVIEREPFYIGVQSDGCAPLVDAWKQGKLSPIEVTPAETLAEGVKVVSPVRGGAILARMRNDKGKLVSIPEEEIKAAYTELAKMGIYCEPTSALVWAAIKPTLDLNVDPTVAIITGSGYKSNLNLDRE